MSAHQPPWKQVFATATVVAMASSVGLLGHSSQGQYGANVGTWVIGLAAPLTLGLAVLAWSRGRRRRWMFPLLGILVYGTAGLLTGGFSFERWPPAIPLLMLKPVLYPVAGLVWGLLLRQLWEQGYLAFLGLERPE